jgi:hypothetical protein
MEMVMVVSPIKCGVCTEVTVFEITTPPKGVTSKTFSLDCPNGHPVMGPTGNIEVVDLKQYDEASLRRVRL